MEYSADRQKVRGRRRRPLRGLAAGLIGFAAIAGLAVMIFMARLDYAGRSAPVPREPDGAWALTLVNTWTPLPEDWEISLKEAPGGERVDARIYEPLMEMLEAARYVNLGELPNVESGYRTEADQQAIYDDYLEDYLAEGYSQEDARKLTEQWVALPGTSEHQLGLAVDLSGQVYDVFPWLRENSYKYGFVWRYQADKEAITGIAEETWHYRYVGVEAATEMYEQGLCLEEYLDKRRDDPLPLRQIPE